MTMDLRVGLVMMTAVACVLAGCGLLFDFARYDASAPTSATPTPSSSPAGERDAAEPIASVELASLQVSPNRLELRAGGGVTLSVRVSRSSGDALVPFELIGLPDGVVVEPPAPAIPANGEATSVSIVAGAAARVGSARVVVRARDVTRREASLDLLVKGAPGAPDVTHGRDGLVVAEDLVPGGRASVAALPDGRLAVAWVAFQPAESIVVARFTRQGARDPTFGTNGVVRVPLAAGDEIQAVRVGLNGQLHVVARVELVTLDETGAVASTLRPPLHRIFLGAEPLLDGNLEVLVARTLPPFTSTEVGVQRLTPSGGVLAESAWFPWQAPFSDGPKAKRSASGSWHLKVKDDGARCGVLILPLGGTKSDDDGLGDCRSLLDFAASGSVVAMLARTGGPPEVGSPVLALRGSALVELALPVDAAGSGAVEFDPAARPVLALQRSSGLVVARARPDGTRDDTFVVTPEAPWKNLEPHALAIDGTAGIVMVGVIPKDASRPLAVLRLWQ